MNEKLFNLAVAQIKRKGRAERIKMANGTSIYSCEPYDILETARIILNRLEKVKKLYLLED